MCKNSTDSKESRPPDWRPTREDVALLANVSGSTVSRALSSNPDTSVSKKAKARVLKAARELGYVPNSAAQALRNGRSGMIGFWMCLEFSLYRGMVLDRMRRILSETEYSLAVSDVDEDYAWHHSFSRALRVPVDGIIAFDASLAAVAFAKDSVELAPNLPFVSMGAFWSEEKSYVGVDLKAGAEDAMDHFFATGRKRIVYLTPELSDAWEGDARYRGYRDRMVQFGLKPEAITIASHPATRSESIEKELRERQSEGQMPDAVLCYYDDISFDVVEALQAMNLHPGRDVGVVGFNGTVGIVRGAIPMSTVRQPVEEMCQLAVEFLQAQIEDPATPIEQRILRPELIVRDSSLP